MINAIPQKRLEIFVFMLTFSLLMWLDYGSITGLIAVGEYSPERVDLLPARGVFSAALVQLWMISSDLT
jgi:hypothetical protein